MLFSVWISIIVCVAFFIRLDTGLAPGRKRAYLLYKAAIKEANSLEEVREEGAEEAKPPAAAPSHPYMLALGVLAIQKVSLFPLPPPSLSLTHLEKKNVQPKWCTSYPVVSILTLCSLYVSQYLTEECSIETLKEFKEALQQRDKVRGQLILDLKKKRK